MDLKYLELINNIYFEMYEDYYFVHHFDSFFLTDEPNNRLNERINFVHEKVWSRMDNRTELLKSVQLLQLSPTYKEALSLYSSKFKALNNMATSLKLKKDETWYKNPEVQKIQNERINSLKDEINIIIADIEWSSNYLSSLLIGSLNEQEIYSNPNSKETKKYKHLSTRFELLARYCPELFKKLGKEQTKDRADYIISCILGCHNDTGKELLNRTYQEKHKIKESELKNMEEFLNDSKQKDF